MAILSKKLYRSNKDIYIAGVCAGIAEYFKIDVSFVRIIWAFTSVLFGSGLLVYMIAWLVVPQKPIKNDNSFKGKTIIIE
ncbi:MAG: PspC domain-containing protein [Candidatus Amoebophilus sp.]